MDVYLLPVGPSRYELYCEVADEAGEAVDPATQGVVRRLVHRFQQMIKEAERARRQGAAAAAPAGWAGRVRARALRWVAESIAEQRLLWHLRSQDGARLFHPDDVERHDAEQLLRAQLTRDVEKHRFWLVIDLAGFIVSGLLALIPGPNLVAYYFAFRLVGHYLSMRGARRGLRVVSWSYEASQPLTELRHALALEPSARAFRVRAVADALRLEHLASFFQRSAVST
jgi:hypothetical protein